MTKIFCIAAPAAGAGKTTVSVNLAAAFAALDQNTLLVDCDARNRCLEAAVIDPPADAPGLDRVIADSRDAANFLVPTCIEHFRVLPAGPGLGRAALKPGRNVFSEIAGQDLDMMVINATAESGGLMQEAVCCADVLILPVRLDLEAAGNISGLLETYKHFLEQVAAFRQNNPAGASTARILINGCDDAAEAEALLGPEVFEAIAQLCLPVCIAEDERLHEAMVFGKPVVCHDIISPGAVAFLELAGLWTDIEEIRMEEKKDQIT
ncbi:MAG: ParA family protein [Desulfosalsimonas sp.]|uniref:ParA family protein n=1 Tax=Desulfosalsimonas sp. TaxID=3073848 RepID=UPI0039711666